MAKKTIAQLREIALERFTEDYIHDSAKASNFVNRLYRLSALDDRLLEWENDAERYESPRFRRMVERERDKADRMLDRLRADLKPYGLTIRYYGWLPTLEEIGTQREALTRWYY